MPAALPLSGFGVPAISEGFAAAVLGADRLAGNPRQVVPYSGGLLVAKAVHAVGHIVVRQRLHVGPTFEQARSRVLDGPPQRPEVADDLDGFQNQAIALGQPSGSPGQGSREFRADGRGPDEVEVPGRVGPVIPLLNIGADGGSSRRVRVKTRYLPAKGLEARPTDFVPENNSRSLMAFPGRRQKPQAEKDARQRDDRPQSHSFGRRHLFYVT